MQRIPMTLAGVEQLREELKWRKGEERQRIIQAIQEARAHGDLKENAEYHAAREQQAFNEGRTHHIEEKLGSVQIIDVAKLPRNGKVVFGVTVHLIELDSSEPVVYQIVGDEEADIKKGKISISSPIARALIGKSVDDEVEVRTPSGEIVYTIDHIEYL